MTAPGDHLDFTASGTFRYRLGPHRDLLETIKARLREDPRGLVRSPSGLQTRTFAHLEQVYGVIFRRAGNRIGLVDVFALPQEEHLLSQRLQELERAYRDRKGAV